MTLSLQNALIFIATSALSAGAIAENKPKIRPAPTRNQAAPQGPLYADNTQAMAWADEAAARTGLDRDWVRQQVGNARLLPGVPRLVLPPTRISAKNWTAYRARFIEPIRIGAGKRFWDQHADTLTRAEQAYGVPAEIIIGILGVETLYGRDMGSFRVLDALATLSFDFPDAHPRAEQRRHFFRGELEQFLVLMQQRSTDPTTPRGSYAGAMGLGQFMPSSWARFAVDFDGDGRIDLWNSPADAIGSVANYFRHHGWTPGMPTHFAVQMDDPNAPPAALLAPDIVPTFSADAMAAQGVHVLGAQAGTIAGASASGPLALVQLHNGGKTPHYVAGTGNFYAVTRYNWSSYYALTVIELGRAVSMARSKP